MCTPTSQSPSFSGRMERASSKSLASFGSMVKVVTFRKSSAAGYFFGGNFRRNLIRGFLYRLRIDVWQSEFGQDGVHLGSVISGFAENIEHLPDRVLALSGHSVTFTTALSPVFPPFSLSLGMKMSLASVRFSVTRKAYDFSTSSVPTKVSLARCNISITSPSASHPRFWHRRRCALYHYSSHGRSYALRRISDLRLLRG